VLFGDGAGAVVLSPAKPGEPAIMDFCNLTDGTGGPALQMPAGGSRMPASHETVDQRLHYVKQDGGQVFKFAVRMTEEISRRILDRNHLKATDVDLFVSHQANRRIIEAAADRLGLGEDKVIINLERFGNTTAATDPARADRRPRAGAIEKRRSRTARVSRRGIYGGVGVVEVGTVETGSTFRVSRSGFAVPGSGFGVPGFEFRVTRTENAGTALNPEPETRNPKPGTRCLFTNRHHQMRVRRVREHHVRRFRVRRDGRVAGERGAMFSTMMCGPVSTHFSPGFGPVANGSIWLASEPPISM
jgi:hypothetical protein